MRTRPPASGPRSEKPLPYNEAVSVRFLSEPPTDLRPGETAVITFSNVPDEDRIEWDDSEVAFTPVDESDTSDSFEITHCDDEDDFPQCFNQATQEAHPQKEPMLYEVEFRYRTRRKKPSFNRREDSYFARRCDRHNRTEGKAVKGPQGKWKYSCVIVVATSAGCAVERVYQDFMCFRLNNLSERQRDRALEQIKKRRIRRGTFAQFESRTVRRLS